MLNEFSKCRKISLQIPLTRPMSVEVAHLVLEVMLWLCTSLLGVIKQVLQGVDLHGGHGEHDEQVEAGPEGHPPQVVLQEVTVPRLKGSQRGLDLPGPLQLLVHKLQPGLEGGDERGIIKRNGSG